MAAIREFEELKNDPLFLQVLCCIGEKVKSNKNPGLRLGNSEPEMVRIFHLFLTKRLK